MSLTTLSSPVETLKKEIEDTGMIDSLSNEFVQELMDYGIETVSQFEEAYHGQYQSGAEFAEQLCDDCGYLSESNLPMFIQFHIDWESVWSRELTFDYFMVKYSNGYAFFTNNF